MRMREKKTHINDEVYTRQDEFLGRFSAAGGDREARPSH